jgi:hypothetical protein
MSNRQIKVLAAVFVVSWVGYCNQAAPAYDQANDTTSSPTSPASSDSDDEYPSAVAVDDSDDSSDDLISLRGALNLLPSLAIVGLSRGHSTIIGPPQRSTSATLASQHILLRL